MWPVVATPLYWGSPIGQRGGRGKGREAGRGERETCTCTLSLDCSVFGGFITPVGSYILS